MSRAELKLAAAAVAIACPLIGSVANAQSFARVADSSGITALRAGRPSDWWLSGLTLVDLEGDGDLDLFMSSHTGEPSDVAVNDGAGHFSRPAGSWPESEVHLMYDLNEDGLVDMSVTYVDGGGRWWLNRSTGSEIRFEETDITREGNQARQQSLADIDRDGRIEWLRGAYAVRFDHGVAGPDFFEEDTGSRSLPDMLDGVSPMAVDLDGDGMLDLVVESGRYDGEEGFTHIFRGRGGFSFDDVTAASGLNPDGLAILGVADVDHDGDIDLIGINQLEFPMSIFLNDGAGHFSESAGAVDGPSSGAPNYGSWGLASSTDLDNDGQLDLLISGRNFLHVLRGTGGGHFHYANDDWNIINLAEASVDSGYAFGDIDADGDIDLVGYRDLSPREIEVYRNDLPAQNWIRVRPIGLSGNHGATGAIVELRDSDSGALLWREQILIACKQAQQNGYGFAETERHYGLGAHEHVDVSVQFYPSGTIVALNDVPTGSVARLAEDGSGGTLVDGGTPPTEVDGGGLPLPDAAVSMMDGATVPGTDGATAGSDGARADAGPERRSRSCRCNVQRRDPVAGWSAMFVGLVIVAVRWRRTRR